MQYLVWIRIYVQLLQRKLTVGPAVAAAIERFSAQSVVFQIQFFLFPNFLGRCSLGHQNAVQ